MLRRIRICDGSDSSRALAAVVASLALAAVTVSGCSKDEDPVVVYDNGPPSAPDGVFSITGDAQVEICWNPNPEPDIAAYELYWNTAPTGTFTFIARVDANTTCYVDADVTNGNTYFYAVLAVDRDGLESGLSIENVFDTPRPEGTNLVLFDYLGQNGGLSGYDFSSLSGVAQAYNNPTTDVYFGNFGTPTVPTLVADQVAGVDVQDYGFIDLLSVSWAPAGGWAPSGRVELIPGHSYVVRIVASNGTFNVAKFHAVSVSAASVTLDWAYQIGIDNPELAPGFSGERN